MDDSSPKVDIVAALSSALKKANTSALDISFNELADMKQSGELNISPDYQRLFRWTEGQRSRLIESILLEMPLPPIFVIEDKEGHYQLIDGLQRISSYLHLRGLLDAPHYDPPIKIGDYLELVDCDIVPELNGYKWDDFPVPLQIRLKRSFVRVEVVRSDSDPRFKYHMFKRLNTGGDRLSDQQIRNATIRMLNSDFADYINRLRDTAAFATCIVGLTQERMLSAMDQELVLRFFALKNRISEFKHEVGDFLTEFMEDVAIGKETFDYAAEEIVFNKTFEILSSSIGEQAFAFWNKKSQKITSGFSILHYEAFTIALQEFLDQFDASDVLQMSRLKSEIENIKSDQRFLTATTGGGKNSPGLMRERIGLAREAFERAVG